MRQHIHFARERHLHDEVFGIIDYLGKGTRVLGPLAVQTCPGAALLRINKETVEHVKEVIATRTIDRPVLPKRFIRAKNFFDHNVEWPIQDSLGRLAGLGQRGVEERGDFLLAQLLERRIGLAQPVCHAEDVVLLEALEILLWIVEPIRMIDAHPVHLALAQQAQDQPVGGSKHFRFFHTQRGQFVDIEEAPVVDLFRSDTPVTETIDLGLQQSIQEIKTLRLARHAVEERYRILQKGTHRRVRLGQRCQAPLDDFLFALALGYSRWVSLAAQRQVTNGGENAVVLCQWLWGPAQKSSEFITPLFQDEGIALGRHRPTVVKVVDGKGPGGIPQADLLGLQGLAIGLPQDWQQQAFMHLHT